MAWLTITIVASTVSTSIARPIIPNCAACLFACPGEVSALHAARAVSWSAAARQGDRQDAEGEHEEHCRKVARVRGPAMAWPARCLRTAPSRHRISCLSLRRGDAYGRSRR